MSRFRVTAHMKAPLVLGGGYFTLDGLLGALLFDRLDGPPAACNRMKQEGTETSAVSYRINVSGQLLLPALPPHATA